jgi:hypothetical protein
MRTQPAINNTMTMNKNNLFICRVPFFCKCHVRMPEVRMPEAGTGVAALQQWFSLISSEYCIIF